MMCFLMKQIKLVLTKHLILGFLGDVLFQEPVLYFHAPLNFVISEPAHITLPTQAAGFACGCDTTEAVNHCVASWIAKKVRNVIRFDPSLAHGVAFWYCLALLRRQRIPIKPIGFIQLLAH